MMKLIVLLCCVAYVYSQAQGTCPSVDKPDPVYLPDAKYCGKFYECSGGKAFEIDCAPGTYFDITQSECDTDVNCGDRILSTRGPLTTASTEPSASSEPFASSEPSSY